MLDFIRKSGFDAFQRIDADEKLREKLRNFNFDIAFTQSHEWGGYALFHRLGLATYVTVASSTIGSGYSHLIGAPLTPSYVPAMHSMHGDEMNIFERFENFIVTEQERQLYCSGFDEMDEWMREKYGQYPGSMEMAGRSSFLFTNSDPLMDFPRPLLAKIVFIGGITVPPFGSMKLTENLDEILNKRKFNILISFGSMTKSVDMPAKYKKSLIGAMKRFPEVTFLWKYENLNDEWTRKMSENVLLEKWYPQLALLEDDRLTGFITHTGAGSLNELTSRGKKAICVPLFADQFTYARQLERIGVAIYLSKKNLADEEKIVAALKRLIDDKNLSENAKKLAKMLAKRPQKPRDTVVKVTEYAAEFGPLNTLDPHGRKISFAQYYLLDIFAILFLVFVLITVFIFLFIRAIYRWIYCCFFGRNEYKRVSDGKNAMSNGKRSKMKK